MKIMYSVFAFKMLLCWADTLSTRELFHREINGVLNAKCIPCSSVFSAEGIGPTVDHTQTKTSINQAIHIVDGSNQNFVSTI